MLKIKDNIDLKKLEKFGFVKVKMHKGYKNKRYFTNTKGGTYIIVDDENKGTDFYKRLSSGDWEYSNNLDILYDLIKADMVEKVE